LYQNCSAFTNKKIPGEEVFFKLLNSTNIHTQELPRFKKENQQKRNQKNPKTPTLVGRLSAYLYRLNVEDVMLPSKKWSEVVNFH